ncbi:MAG: UDP-2,3-diacylglucosamine diphosphatase LpxI [Pseudomonadota bacterium]|nr:UDP-2,3-diacylglucosamine diphosphatase LpxI [Pseudomonadota bacterium]
MAENLGILAGGGDLPRRLVEACRTQGRSFFILGFEGHADRALMEGLPYAWVRLGAWGDILGRLRQEGVTELVMAGHVRRPSLAELKPDWRAAKFLARIGLRALGDDGLLSAVAKEFEGEGFRVVAAHDILGTLLAPAGVWGSVRPDEAAWTDIRRGMEVVRALGRLDVGQAAVVQQGLVLGVEGVEGTAELVRRCTVLKREGGGGVLVKASKPQQDRRVDLPAVGPDTVKTCADAGLAGIAVEAGGALVLDLASVVTEADRHGLFVVGVEREQGA